MTTVHGRKPTPRVLVDVSDDELASGIEAMFETVHRLARPGDLNRLRQAEWDVLVTDRDRLEGFASIEGQSSIEGQYWLVESHLFVLLLGWGARGRLSEIPSPHALAELHLDEHEVAPAQAFPVTVMAIPTVAKELYVPELDDPPLEDLVKQTLLPLIEDREHKFGLSFDGDEAQRPDHFSAFLETTEPVALAGRFKRDRHMKVECWVLPDGVRQPLEWVRVAVRRWQSIAPERFERLPGWERAHPWLTAEEQRLEDELAAHDQKRHELLGQLDAERAGLEHNRMDARQAAEAGPRRLLTAKSTELVAAVSDALTELGFGVVDVDAKRGPGDKLHDLEVTDPAEAGWTALVEVKGYRGSARVNDLLRFGRYRERFHDDHGRWPDACWYVVNQHAGRDPSERPEVLHANRDERATFAEDGGLAMDTAALFAVVRSVELGEVHRSEARQRLRATAGLFEWPPTDPGVNERGAGRGHPTR